MCIFSPPSPFCGKSFWWLVWHLLAESFDHLLDEGTNVYLTSHIIIYTLYIHCSPTILRYILALVTRPTGSIQVNLHIHIRYIYSMVVSVPPKSYFHNWGSTWSSDPTEFGGGLHTRFQPSTSTRFHLQLFYPTFSLHARSESFLLVFKSLRSLPSFSICFHSFSTPSIGSNVFEALHASLTPPTYFHPPTSVYNPQPPTHFRLPTLTPSTHSRPSARVSDRL